MKTVGIFEAKNRLSELIGEVERGETVVLTRHGKPVAEIVPGSEDVRRAEAEEAMSWILSRRWTLDGLTVKELVNRGRRLIVLDTSAAIPWFFDDERDEFDMKEDLPVAERNKLSVYDALYVRLARERHLTLVTRDRNVAAAARKENVVVEVPAT